MFFLGRIHKEFGTNIVTQFWIIRYSFDVIRDERFFKRICISARKLIQSKGNEIAEGLDVLFEIQETIILFNRPKIRSPFIFAFNSCTYFLFSFMTTFHWNLVSKTNTFCIKAMKQAKNCKSYWTLAKTVPDLDACSEATNTFRLAAHCGVIKMNITSMKPSECSH